MSLNAAELPTIDAEFDEITEAEEQDRKERLKTKWAALESLVGDEKRIRLIAKDFVDHFERRLEAMDGKAMIVCMSRRICVELYDEIVKLRPKWHDTDDGKGGIKIVMTGSASDPAEWQGNIRNKRRRKKLAKRSKTRKTHSRSSSCGTCGLPVLTPHACTRCIWTSRCGATV